MTEVCVLRLDEGVRLEPARLAALHARLGPKGAGHEVGDAMEELATRLHDMERFAAEGKPASLRRSGEHLVETATRIGMVTLAQVAGDVMRCAASGDNAGLGATLARLIRVGDRSLTAEWESQDITM